MGQLIHLVLDRDEDTKNARIRHLGLDATEVKNAGTATMHEEGTNALVYTALDVEKLHELILRGEPGLVAMHAVLMPPLERATE